jgi:GH24 family phage-related lysozyme (muramidase)
MNPRESFTWIAVTTAMPKPGTKVLAAYQLGSGNWRIVIGEYIPRFFSEIDPDSDVEGEYCEDAELYYLPAGWYEQQDNCDDYCSIFIHQGEVSHWRSLPTPPVIAAQERAA